MRRSIWNQWLTVVGRGDKGSHFISSPGVSEHRHILYHSLSCDVPATLLNTCGKDQKKKWVTVELRSHNSRAKAVIFSRKHCVWQINRATRLIFSLLYAAVSRVGNNIFWLTYFKINGIWSKLAPHSETDSLHPPSLLIPSLSAGPLDRPGQLALQGNSVLYKVPVRRKGSAKPQE